MATGRYRAILCDLDGVVTRTAALHARAWKATFDELLAERAGVAGALSPFDAERDYQRYVDGKPRDDGVRSFLAARGIVVPEGAPDDDAKRRTVRGLGNRKNALFLELLQEEGVATYPDALAQLELWRRLGMQTALVTSSRSGRAIVEGAGIAHLFDVVVDWTDAEPLGLRGKPAPDIFLEAARRLAVDPAQAVVLEDAISGVEAGRAGGFGLVVGVARAQGRALLAHGADLEVRDLRDLGDLTGR